MKIAVIANAAAWEELAETSKEIEWIRMDDTNAFNQGNNFSAFFDLSGNAGEKIYSDISAPVFIHSVDSTLAEIKAEKNVIRINGWTGFIKRDMWEAAGHVSDMHSEIIHALNKKILNVPDEPGFISGRIISMIINEAFYAKGEQVSSEDEIDIAMKLGTNYPFGPFEWCRNIGTRNIYQLLLKLSKTDKRYQPSPLLELEANQ